MAGPNLARMIGEPERTVQLRQAVVSAVAASGGTISVKLGNSATAIDGVRRLSSSSIVVNDVVWVLQQGYDLLALGRVADAAYGTQGMNDGLELYHPASTPYIDFHRAANPAGDGGADYDIRLINDTNDRLSVAGGSLHIDGVSIRGNGGRNYFKDSEKNNGTGLRVGAAWGRYGIYSEDGDVTVGSSNARFSVQNDVHWMDDNGLKTQNAFAGRSGAHGSGWAQFSAHNFWNSSGRYGIMHNTGDGHLLLSSYQINFRIENADKLLIGASSVEPKTNLALYDNLIRSRAWNDDWHVWGWWSGNDGLRITEYGGLYFRVRDMDPVLRIEPYATSTFSRWDQAGGWDTAAIITRSHGGGSPAMISWHEQGRNAAHLIKSWFSALECRSWDNAGWGIFRGELEDYSSAQSKANIRRAKDRLTKADRRAKQRRVEAAHFNRKRGGCANCKGTGKAKTNERIRDHNIRAKHESNDLVEIVPGDDDCPDCGGLGRAFMHAHDVKTEEAGWFGFISEEVEREFPEACYYRPSEADNSVIEVSGLSVQALVALLWEDNKDQQEEIDALEARLAKVEGKVK